MSVEKHADIIKAVLRDLYDAAYRLGLRDGQERMRERIAMAANGFEDVAAAIRELPVEE